jgi:hypothetical protein
MNDAQAHVLRAKQKLESALVDLEEAAGVVNAQGLKDFDGRALALARTNAEQADMWAARALA